MGGPTFSIAHCDDDRSTSRACERTPLTIARIPFTGSAPQLQLPPTSDRYFAVRLRTCRQLYPEPAASYTPNPASTASVPPRQDLDPDVIANMIRHNPTLQNIDPTLLAIGVMQDRQRPAATMASTPTTCATPHHLKRNRDAFQVITPQSYGAQPKRPRRGKLSKRTSAIRGSENVAPDDEILS